MGRTHQSTPSSLTHYTLKVDRCYGWKPLPDGPIREALAQQDENVILEFKDRTERITVQVRACVVWFVYVLAFDPHDMVVHSHPANNLPYRITVQVRACLCLFRFKTGFCVSFASHLPCCIAVCS